MPLNFQQNIRFKNVPEQPLQEFDFIGGLVTDPHETKLQPNQSPDMANVVFTDTHSIKTRNGYLRYNGDPIASSSDEANTGASTGTITLDAVSDWVAQTFQVGAGASIVQCDFYLAMNTGGQEQYMKAELWSGSTGPSAKLIDGQILLVSGTSETEYSFRFNVPYALTASTEYAVVLKPYIAQTTTQTINTVLVHRTGNAYANGAAYSSTDSGISWSAVASTDLKFNVYTGATATTGMIRFYNTTGTKQTFVKVGSSLYRGNDGTGAMTTISLPSGVSLSSSEYIDYTVANDTLLVIDKTNYIKKYRGSTNSDYTTGTITATNNSTTVTGSGTSWNTSTNAETGEYIKLPDGKWYKIVAIGSNTSLTIETAYLGSTLSGQTYTISPWGEIQGKLNTATAPSGLNRPQPDFIENHLNRIWTLEGNTLRFSALDTSVTEEHFNDFDTANNAGSIIIPSSKGDIGTGLYSLNNGLYVFQRRSIWRLLGSSPSNFELRNVTNEIGMIDKRTLVEYGDLLTFLSDKGVYLFDGSNLKNISEGVVNTSIDAWANKTSPVAVLWNNTYLISYTSNSGSYNDEALFYHYEMGVWGKFENIHASDWVVWDGSNDSGQIYFSSSNQGVMYRFDTGSHDDGYEITTRYVTPSLSFGTGMNDKAIKKFYIQQLSLGDWEMTVTQLANISETETTGTAINLSPGTNSLWDTAVWDTDVWSSEGSIITTRIAEFQGLAKYFKFQIDQSGYGEGIEVLGILPTVRTRRLQ
jgi:hypothetical protein